MINEDVWVHILETRNKAHYLLAKFNDEDAKNLVEAVDVIYYKYKEVVDYGK